MRSTRMALNNWLHGGIAAFQFLTRLPIPVQIEYTGQVFRRSVVFYPLAGLVIGLILFFAGQGLRFMMPAMPAAVLLLGLWVFLTGGLHLDGLMDTADGILSHRPLEQMLEIMKDSRVGAMGVIVCVLHLLLKFSLLFSMLGSEQGGWKAASFFLVMIPIWSRWFMVVAIYGWPYARRESGLGSLFHGVTKGYVALSTVGALLVTTIAAAIGHSRLTALLGAVPAWSFVIGFFVLTFLGGYLAAVYISRKLGGLTGDTYGALNELLEAFLLLVAVAVCIT
ncbi:adenosylcobinamide-GDP ribazoletransferase [Paenibacillus sp. SYP-B3998]|uniref:Adenosylcobinamide-GDP ribazoletransferase n=1 Tax=Paenibacillus sp. SYP-B3998 TaxID=2678564 RepID=A0A6G4A2Z5_9BACL|nr:adenosylcobinamide-GDP ribazoletransferase [Paenibacillus sp. SYP-B3998]NEW08189.1 adenosylcobinamide-GDP ribazoletransferase [Paenibacillus sp. SYP-B3998]